MINNYNNNNSNTLWGSTANLKRFHIFNFRQLQRRHEANESVSDWLQHIWPTVWRRSGGGAAGKKIQEASV